MEASTGWGVNSSQVLQSNLLMFVESAESFPSFLNLAFTSPVFTFKPFKHTIKNSAMASLVAQWLRIRLPMQGTRVRALV